MGAGSRVARDENLHERYDRAVYSWCCVNISRRLHEGATAGRGLCVNTYRGSMREQCANVTERE